MVDLFAMHTENKIGIKRLSDADLGLGKSHQTHIGLYGEVLAYLPDHFYSEKGLLFNDGNYNLVTMFFDRITNPDGTTRSPKFRLGEANTVSLVGCTREIVKDNPNEVWYLLWFGIANGSIISILFNEQDNFFELMEIQGIMSKKEFKKVISDSDISFSSLVDTLQGWILSIMHDSLREIETSLFSKKSLIARDLELNKIFNLSERLYSVYQLAVSHISQYLESQKHIGVFLGYELLPRIGNQSYSYIFSIIKKTGESKKMILKATEFDIKQPFMLNFEDLQLIHETHSYSAIGMIRLFEIDDNGCMMQICDSLQQLTSQVLDSLAIDLEAIFQVKSPIKNIVLEVNPSNYPVKFKQIVMIST